MLHLIRPAVQQSGQHPRPLRGRADKSQLNGTAVPPPGGTKPKCTTLVHFAPQPFRSVILSAAKNLTARPFAEFILSVAEGLRVTDLLCQSFAVWFRDKDREEAFSLSPCSLGRKARGGWSGLCLCLKSLSLSLFTLSRAAAAGPGWRSCTCRLRRSPRH